MKIIMISKDAKVFEKGSAVRARMLEYGALFEELHVIVCAKTADTEIQEKISANTFLYSSHSDNFFFIFLKTLGIAFKVVRKIKDKENVWITAQDPFETGFLAFIVSRLYKIKLQLQVHTDFLSLGFKRERFINRIRIFVAKRILPSAQSIRVVSQRIKDSLLETLNFKLKTFSIHVLPIFVDVPAIRAQKISFDLHKKYPEFKKIVLIASRLEKEKNIPLALFAFSKLLRKIPDAGLVIAGKGSEEKWIKKYISHLGIEKNVRFEGFVSEIVSAYKTSDVFLVTSFYEGYGMAIVESIASGTPVVSTDVGIAADMGARIVNYDAGQIGLVLNEVLSKEKGHVELPHLSHQEYLSRFKESFS